MKKSLMVQRSSDGKVTLLPEVERFWLEGSEWTMDEGDLTPSLKDSRAALERAEQELAVGLRPARSEREGGSGSHVMIVLRSSDDRKAIV